MELLKLALYKNGIRALMTNAHMTTQERKNLLLEFIRDPQYPVMIVPDHFQRAIHVPDAMLVINFQIPEQYTFYYQRASRVAGFGESFYQKV